MQNSSGMGVAVSCSVQVDGKHDFYKEMNTQNSRFSGFNYQMRLILIQFNFFTNYGESVGRH
jgi:hypothetical protein